MKVLIVGYDCSPVRLGEPAFTWNWARHMASYHHVSVLANPELRKETEAFIAQRGAPNFTLHWVELPKWQFLWLSRDTDRSIRFHYVLWQRVALNAAKKLHQKEQFDLIHHVSLSTVGAPSPFWRVGPPLVWGPIGGAQRAPKSLRRYFGKYARREAWRSKRISLTRFLPTLRLTAQKSAMVLVTNRETAELMEFAGARRVTFFPDSGVDSCMNAAGTAARQLANGKEIVALWVGRILPRKALPIALEILASLRDLPLRLIIAGDGGDRSYCEDYARRLGVREKTTFLGQVAPENMPDVYRSADIFLFTSLRDSLGTQVIEAMAFGLPVVALDHQGVGTFVPADAAIKVPPGEPQKTITLLSDAVRQLALDPSKRARMGESARAFAALQTWHSRAAEMAKIYRSTLTAVNPYATCNAAEAHD